MYQPTNAELEHLWLGAKTMHAEKLTAASQALASIATTIVADAKGITIKCAGDHKAWMLLNEDECTCPHFRERPFSFTPVVDPSAYIQPKPRRPFCQHTLVWYGYRLLLQPHYNFLRAEMPPRLREYVLYQGQLTPRSNEQWWAVACWLANNPAPVAASLSMLATQWRKQERPLPKHMRMSCQETPYSPSPVSAAPSSACGCSTEESQLQRQTQPENSTSDSDLPTPRSTNSGPASRSFARPPAAARTTKKPA